MKKMIGLVAAFFCMAVAFSQPIREPDGGGYFTPLQAADEFSEADYQYMRQVIQQNKNQLEKQNLWAQPLPQITAFQWPTRLRSNLLGNQNPSYLGYYGISNYIDQNTAFPNQVLDYNCGNRSYDLSSGYNHRGTDIFSWPFAWHKMEYNEVEIIAAAPGTIITKFDGNPDKNCAFCTSACNWNAVYVRHADGSVAWYGHLKSGTLTTKPVGATVSVGEYLGIMGSSGNSTGPHLHFEVWENENLTKLVDPWAGACNALNGNTSWWAIQQPYRLSGLNAVMTHGAAPANSQCPAGERVNEKKSFKGGDTVFLGTYYRDQLIGQTVLHEIYLPNNTRYLFWNQSMGATFNASWWYYYIILPANPMVGEWRYDVVHNGLLFRTRFAVGQPLQYNFSGNGSFHDPANWVGARMPSLPVPNGVEVIISSGGSNQCVVNEPVIFLKGAKLTVNNGANIRFFSNFRIEH
jgi:murein DD-endopeptidase MepM/ murein hydrolase activator NlpD